VQRSLALLAAGALIATTVPAVAHAHTPPSSVPPSVSAEVQPRSSAQGAISGLTAFDGGPGQVVLGYFIYRENSFTYDAYLMESRPGAVNWSSPVRFASGLNSTSDVVWPTGASAEGGLAIAVLQRESWLLSVRRSMGSDWSTYAVPRAGTLTSPPVVLPDGTTVVTWTEASGGARYATVSPRGAVSDAQTLSPSASSALLVLADGETLYAFTRAEASPQTSLSTFSPETGWSPPARVCDCTPQAVAWGGDDQFLLTLGGGESIIVRSSGGSPTRIVGSGSQSIAMGGGKVFGVGWQGKADRDQLTRVEYSPVTGALLTSQVLTSVSNRVPGAPADWDARHFGGASRIVVDGQGLPFVAAEYGRLTCFDVFLPKVGARAVDFNECQQVDFYIAEGLAASARQITSQDNVPYALAVSSNGQGALAWLEPLEDCASAGPTCVQRIMTRAFGEAKRDSCLRIPEGGGPIDLKRAVYPDEAAGSMFARPDRRSGKSRNEVRFGAMQAIGCFEPLLKPNKDWPKGFAGPGVFINTQDVTRINGIDVPAPPGALLFDSRAMRIFWLPTTEIELAVMGQVFYRQRATGSFKNPFKLVVPTGMKAITLTLAQATKPITGGSVKAPSILGVDLLNETSIRLTMGVDRKVGGFTEIGVTLPLPSDLKRAKVKRNPKAEDRTKCSTNELNVVVRNAQGKYMRCAAIDPGNPRRTSRWVPVAAEGGLSQVVDPGITGALRTSNAMGLEVRETKLSIETLAVGPYQLENLELTYLPASGARPATLSAKAGVNTGFRMGVGPLRVGRNVKIVVGGSLSVETDEVGRKALSVQALSFSVQGLPIPTGGPTAITRVAASFDRGDRLGGWSLSGSVAWVVGPSMISVGSASYDAASIEGTFTYTSARERDPGVADSKPVPASFTLQGVGSLAGAPLGQVTMDVAMSNGFPSAVTTISLEGDVDLARLPWKWVKRLGVTGSAKIVGRTDLLEGGYQYQGIVRDLGIAKIKKLGGLTVGGDIMVSDRGIAVCAQAAGATVISAGFSYLWKEGKVTTYLTACDVAVVRSTKVS